MVAGGVETLVLDGLTFVWSRSKAKANQQKHGVTFEQAATVFADPLAKVRKDRSASHNEHRMQIMGYSLSWGDFSSSSTLRLRMARQSASSPHARSTRKNGVVSSANSWRPNPYAKRISAADRRLLVMKALAAELGSEFAVLAPDVAEAFPDSEAVNAALRAVLEAAKTIRKAGSRKRTRAA